MYSTHVGSEPLVRLENGVENGLKRMCRVGGGSAPGVQSAFSRGESNVA